MPRFRCLPFVAGPLLLGLVAVFLLALGDDRRAGLAANTLALAAATCAVSVPAGTLVALLLARTDLPGRRLLALLLGGMLFIPLYLHAAAWQAGFGAKGWYTAAISGPVWLEGWRGAVWVHAAAAIPWVVLIVAAGLMFVEPELEEDALLDGTAWQVFRRVTLPRVWAYVGAAALWVAAGAAGEMTVTDLFQIRTYAEELYTEVAIGQGADEASWAVLPGVALAAALAAAVLALLPKVVASARPASLRRPWHFRLGRWRWPTALVVAAAMLVLVGVPLGSLAWKAGVLVTEGPAGRDRHWSLAKALSIVAASPLRYERHFAWSLLTAGLAATASVAAATVLAWLARAGGVRSACVRGLTAAAMALPGPLVGLAIIWLLNRPEVPWSVQLYDRSILPIVAAQIVRALPLAVLVTWCALGSIPAETLESAAVDGASTLVAWRRVVLPERLWALAAAWLVAFAVALGELAASLLVIPPGREILSVHIFNLLHYGVEDQVAGICLALVAGFQAVAYVLAWLLERRYGVFGPGRDRR